MHSLAQSYRSWFYYPSTRICKYILSIWYNLLCACPRSENIFHPKTYYNYYIHLQPPSAIICFVTPHMFTLSVLALPSIVWDPWTCNMTLIRSRGAVIVRETEKKQLVSIFESNLGTFVDAKIGSLGYESCIAMYSSTQSKNWKCVIWSEHFKKGKYLHAPANPPQTKLAIKLPSLGPGFPSCNIRAVSPGIWERLVCYSRDQYWRETKLGDIVF